MSTLVAVIGGSGAYHLLQSGRLGEEKESLTVKTPFGPSAPIHRFNRRGYDFLFISRHGEEDYSLTAPFVNYRANIYALKECGVERILAWSGPGIINRTYRPGELAIPRDVIDETKNRESTFFKNRGYGFIRQKEPFCPQIREVLHDVIHKSGWAHHKEAVYVCSEGPRLESPAEIRKLRIIGGDLVGMTLIPEVFLARELEICYASICYLTNYAEGVVDRAFEKGTIFEGMQSKGENKVVEKALRFFPDILQACFSLLQGRKRGCDCKDAMIRYKNKGMIKNDWREWIGDE